MFKNSIINRLKDGGDCMETMNRDKIYSAIDKLSGNQITITIYRGDEICGRFKMEVLSTDEYDDEVIIYGNDNQSVVLSLYDVDIMSGEENEIEFLFGTGPIKYGVTFLS